MTSAVASTVSHTRPSDYEEGIFGFFDTYPKPSSDIYNIMEGIYGFFTADGIVFTNPKSNPSPKAVEKNTTAVDQSKGQQNMSV